MTQAALAAELGLSQSRLSEIERGDGSFTAEQLLTLLRLFNVGVSHFDDSVVDPDRDLQDALARFGARHLVESLSGIPDRNFEDLYYVLESALVAGTARFVTALAPVLLQHVERVNLAKIQIELLKIGRERRLPWLVENVRTALDMLVSSSNHDDQHWSRARRRVEVPFRLFLDIVALAPAEGRGAPDVLDPTIRSQKSLDDVCAASSAISQRWRIATSLQPEDFVEALRASRAAG